MRKLFSIFIAVLLTATLWAQSPNKMSYQAVIRDASNNLITNTAVAMQISILQGSTSGTVVYVETQTPTTNINGLVSIEIGGGAVVSGDFSTVNWANGPYFVKTETDPDGSTGGVSYTITTTSQLLSVPYALHVKTAESLSNEGAHYVGELYGGGVVFWVDHTGKHGLIVNMDNLSSDHVWSDVSTLIGTTNDWDGASNTTAITGQGGHTSSAAKLCEDYTNKDYGTGIYTDWYLPSITELNHLWNNFYQVQKALTNDGNASTTPLARTFYWSSTELDNNFAWSFEFYFGKTNTSYDKSKVFFVRAVRAF